MERGEIKGNPKVGRLQKKYVLKKMEYFFLNLLLQMFKLDGNIRTYNILCKLEIFDYILGN